MLKEGLFFRWEELSQFVGWGGSNRKGHIADAKEVLFLGVGSRISIRKERNTAFWEREGAGKIWS